MLAVHLIKTYCLPMLLYSCEIWGARPIDMRSVNVFGTMHFAKFLMLVGEKALSRCSSTAPVYQPLSLYINVEFFFWLKMVRSDNTCRLF